MNALRWRDAGVHVASRLSRYREPAWAHQAYQGVMVMRTVRKVIVAALFALACTGSVAVAGPVEPCDAPCWRAYQMCLASGADAGECQQAYSTCVVDLCMGV